jgi:hypothetical protein
MQIDNTVNIMMLSSQLEKALLHERRKDKSLIEEFPWITLPPGYSFKVTFPFAGACARFRVCKENVPDKSVSVYLDTKDVLGYFGSPYWEAYPIGDDVARFPLDDTKGLVEAIVTQLSQPD